MILIIAIYFYDSTISSMSLVLKIITDHPKHTFSVKLVICLINYAAFINFFFVSYFVEFL